MTTSCLIIRVHLYERRYHGGPEWPPSPARLYQALVAGAGPRIEEPLAEALSWLEGLSPPIIAAPDHRAGQVVPMFMPNNNLDAKGGDPARVGDIRALKPIQARLLQGEVFLYLWPNLTEAPAAVRVLVEGLFQLGRGVDPAWAELEIVDSEEGRERVHAWEGDVFFPTVGGRSGRLACPQVGTFRSLELRHGAQGRRFEELKSGRGFVQVFSQPPRARFREVSYGAGPARCLLEIRPESGEARFEPWDLVGAHDLVVQVRDAAAGHLGAALPDLVDEIDGVVVGRRRGTRHRSASGGRVRIIPLPSVGHRHTEPSIRRILVELPRGGRLRSDDLRWAFSGLKVGCGRLVESGDDRMLRRYMDPAAVWQSITPVALGSAGRRRDEARARDAVRQALRHAGVRTPVESIWVQREPLQVSGAPAPRFAAGRFSAAHLWHVELRFRERVGGPLVIGDGRFLGLGVMVPRDRNARLWAWEILSGLSSRADAGSVATCLRRAIMARYPGRKLPAWISGHGPDGAPAVGHDHLYFLADLPRGRVLVVDPSSGSRRAAGRRFEEAVEGLVELRCGASGLLGLRAVTVDAEDPLVGASVVWQSVTPYRVQRHEKRSSARDAVEYDLRRELRVRNLPAPVGLEVRDIRSNRGLSAMVRIEFSVAVRGPLLLGRSAHKGGGVFVGEKR